jgi:16S rRNA (cytosine967-C5)-methyltransferase
MNINEKTKLFTEKIQKTFPENYQEILDALQNYPKTSFRVNTLKTSKTEVLTELEKEGFQFEKGPFENSYILIEEQPEHKLSRTKMVDEGRIYIQGLSSMYDALELDPRPGERILDMCAAPGGKTSHIAQITQNKAEITAVENNKNRFFALKENLEKLGIPQTSLFLEAAQFLDKNHPDLIGTFDKVLLDAPCSNEGIVCLSNPKALEKWNPKHAKRLSQLQKKLIATGIRMLKPGGFLVYSTCTFSKEENEEVIDWALKKFPQMKVGSQKRIIPDGKFTGFFAARLLKLS